MDIARRIYESFWFTLILVLSTTSCVQTTQVTTNRTELDLPPALAEQTLENQDTWPREITADGGVVIIYQPQPQPLASPAYPYLPGYRSHDECNLSPQNVADYPRAWFG